jgi:predicted RNase H-like nuclease
MSLGAWKEITDVYGAKITKASYRFSDRMVTVRTPFGSKTAHVGSHTPERLARTLLRELVGKENA